MRAASPCSRHPNTAVHTTRACSCYAWVVPPASGYARRIASPESTQPPMTHVTGTGTFFGHSTQRRIAGCAHLGFQRHGRREARATALSAPTSHRLISPELLLGVDSEWIKTGPGWGEQPGPAGLTTVKGGSGDSSLALSRRRAPFARWATITSIDHHYQRKCF
jgi:hypothetical protein